MLNLIIKLLSAHPKLDITPNTVDYHDLRERDKKVCMERCAIRNSMAREMNAEAVQWAKDTEIKAKKKAQDHVVDLAWKSVADKKTMPLPIQKDVDGKLQKVLDPRGYEDFECSCCAWGKVFWEEKRKMRFLFAVGG